MIKYACSALLVLSLSACQTVQFEQPNADTNFGAKPDYSESELKLIMGAELKDEESARYRFGEVQKAYCNNGLLGGGKLVWSGWVLPVELNGKNSYGAYTGYTQHYARYENGKLLDVSSKDSLGSWDFTPVMGIGCNLIKVM